eukprot:NODE_3609_length_764_cov_261.263752.p3 GENE.NODE_3609_length_764_cov_261.263752~~NODE_3609_length_764_cov_261.263752.p3  ORF type:complete len:133 (-),score=36.61 NODE_3609_length_764_cov_261.263752:348-746(-)
MGERLQESHRAQSSELQRISQRAMRWEAPADAISSCSTIAEVAAWETDLREEFVRTLGRFADRRVELRVAAALNAHDPSLCKICFDRPTSCALLPCAHHAFCVQCAEHVHSTRRTCPLCRSSVSGLLETFSG